MIVANGITIYDGVKWHFAEAEGFWEGPSFWTPKSSLADQIKLQAQAFGVFEADARSAALRAQQAYESRTVRLPIIGTTVPAAPAMLGLAAIGLMLLVLMSASLRQLAQHTQDSSKSI